MKTVLNQLLDWCNEFDDQKIHPTQTNLKEKIWQLLPEEQKQIHSLDETIAFHLGELIYLYDHEHCYMLKNQLADKINACNTLLGTNVKVEYSSEVLKEAIQKASKNWNKVKDVDAFLSEIK